MLTPIDTLKLLNNRPEQQVKAGEVIFQVGEPGDVMYVWASARNGRSLSRQ